MSESSSLYRSISLSPTGSQKMKYEQEASIFCMILFLMHCTFEILLTQDIVEFKLFFYQIFFIDYNYRSKMRRKTLKVKILKMEIEKFFKIYFSIKNTFIDLANGSSWRPISGVNTGWTVGQGIDSQTEQETRASSARTSQFSKNWTGCIFTFYKWLNNVYIELGSMDCLLTMQDSKRAYIRKFDYLTQLQELAQGLNRWSNITYVPKIELTIKKAFAKVGFRSYFLLHFIFHDQCFIVSASWASNKRSLSIQRRPAACT